MYQYILEPSAQSEYEKSLEWYTERSEKASIHFILGIENTLKLICKNPYQFKNAYKTF
jgi:plasmid stabilization system protein ParE